MATQSLPDQHTIRAALELAVRAPSVHNSQPWRFHLRPGSIQLHADPTRHLTATDPDGRDLLISCGAALHHLRVALAALGYLPVTHRFPNPERPNHLATIETLPRTPTHADVTLAVTIPRRRCDRRAYTSRSIATGALDDLARIAAAESVSLRVVQSTDARAHLVSAIAQADLLQRTNPGYVHELATWTGRPDRTRGGLPVTLPTAAGYGDLPLRQFAASHLHDLTPHPEPDGAGTLLVLGTTTDNPLSWLRAGEATSAVLLAATKLHLATCPLTQPLEIPTTRNLVRARVLHNLMTPHMILRIGHPLPYPNPFPITRRRPVAAILDQGGRASPGLSHDRCFRRC